MILPLPMVGVSGWFCPTWAGLFRCHRGLDEGKELKVWLVASPRLATNGTWPATTGIYGTSTCTMGYCGISTLFVYHHGILLILCLSPSNINLFFVYQSFVCVTQIKLRWSSYWYVCWWLPPPLPPRTDINEGTWRSGQPWTRSRSALTVNGWWFRPKYGWLIANDLPFRRSDLSRTAICLRNEGFLFPTKETILVGRSLA